MITSTSSTVINPFLSSGTSAFPGSTQAGVTSQASGTTNAAPTIPREAGDSQSVPGISPEPGTQTQHDYNYMKNPDSQTVAPSQSPGGSLYYARQQLFSLAYSDQASFLTLQQSLIDAGFLDPRSRSYHPGMLSVNDATYKAYGQLARTAIAKNQDINSILNDRADQHLGQKFLTQSKTTTASQTNLSDPTTVQGLLTDSMSRLLGRKPTPNELAQAVNAIQQQESANPQTSTTTATTQEQYANGADTGLGTVKDSTQTTQGGADPGQLADNYVTSHYGTEANDHSLRGYVSAFEKMIGGGTSG